MNILVLCTGNSARSIIGEALISAQPGFQGYSAGSQPKENPHPMALNVLKARGHDVSGYRSKSWD
ncbi:MAG: arsenate reductase ArsC, partial [Pseudomonadota bacterium]